MNCDLVIRPIHLGPSRSASANNGPVACHDGALARALCEIARLLGAVTTRKLAKTAAIPLAHRLQKIFNCRFHGTLTCEREEKSDEYCIAAFVARLSRRQW
jgi:hypothetical protein